MDDKTKDLEKKELNELSDEETSEVSGGHIHRRAKGYFQGETWEVIDDRTGKVLGFYSQKSDAEKTSSIKGQCSREISDSGLTALRKMHKQEKERESQEKLNNNKTKY